ncbi:glycosyltransferase [Streptomyces sp. YU58]|uniref:glycosyltransferase n=1 Tax=Streptomyces sp. SX92 TaxID=3158972 RepID=UPI0027BA943E|nr:glycosyltransferase [Streptomyces coralus]WLW55232.1 hypothetical protein QU709_29545 [Streptomyces coralus]
MKTVALLVKNGIGFGHLRRAVLIAEAMQKGGRLKPVIISQASSLSLFKNTPVDVVNFPLLHRVSSAVAEDAYTAILDRLLDKLDPAVVVEDTYPDPRYLALPSLADRPRLLVMRRLDGASFDHLRSQGRFAAFDKVLIAQSRADFALEGHSGESAAAVECSGRFSFVGNLSYTPTPEEIARTRAEYAPHGEPLVVVNGGAGGDQMPDGYGDQLFGACAQIAERLLTTGHRARFVFVTGPYYAGRPLSETVNVTVRRYEPRLAALLAAAHVAVIKPGNNALSEALSGQAHLVLVPDVSFLEGLDEHASRVVDQYGGATSTADADVLEQLVREALDRLPRTERPEANQEGLFQTLEAIEDLAHPVRPRVPQRQLMLALTCGEGRDAAGLRGMLPSLLENVQLLDGTSVADAYGLASATVSRPGERAGIVVLPGAEPPAVPPQEFIDRGARLAITPGPVPRAITRWIELAPAVPALGVLAAEHVVAREGSLDANLRRIARTAARRENACVILDLSHLADDDGSVKHYLQGLAEWLGTQPVTLLSSEEAIARVAQRLLEQS